MYPRIPRTPQAGSELEGLPPSEQQLCLKLGMPWEGVSPRYLTRAHFDFSLGARGDDPPEPSDSHPAQLSLFPEEKSNG